MKISAIILTIVCCCTIPNALSTPGLSVQVFIGDLGDQKFLTLSGELEQIGNEGTTTQWQCRLATESGKPQAITLYASSIVENDTVRWSYRVVNQQPKATVCSVTFPIINGVRFGDSWADNRVVWPSLAQGALISDLTSPEVFKKQARTACKNHSFLHGLYQGDLCLPFFVHLGKGKTFGIMVLDPTHEVVTFQGTRHETGMRYEVTTHPRIPNGKSWRFGDIEVFQSDHADWHTAADRYRKWLLAKGFSPEKSRRGDVASAAYGRWDGLRPDEVIRWTRALGIKDVCLWLHLYGRGDQYYPCYFPPPSIGMKGMAKCLKQLRDAGVAPYFYTNGYLLSPLQTPADVKEWTKKFPKKYPHWLNDKGYAETVAQFRAQGYEYAGDWLQNPGGLLPMRVRRVNFRWGEFPLYFWHKRPFWAACVATPEWRKLFRDATRLHTQLGARGIFIDQVAAIHPELCAANAHEHDGESFGFWNRAYLRLLSEVKRIGDAVEPGFFIEVEGASDLYTKYVDRCLCWDWGNTPQSLPQLLRYTVPWVRTNIAIPRLVDLAGTLRIIEKTLLLGCIFRVSVGKATGKDDPNNPLLKSESVHLLKAAIQTRRRLADFFDYGRYMDDVGMQSRGCAAARWFESETGVLITAQVEEASAEVSLHLLRDLRLDAAKSLDWRTGTKAPAKVERRGELIVVKGLTAGLNLIVIPAR